MSMFGMEAMPLKRAQPPGSAIVRILPRPTYDTEVAKAATSINLINFFAKPQGQSDASGVITSKGIAETNIKGQAGTFPRPQEFDVFGFFLKVTSNSGTVPVTRADWDLIYLGAYFQFLMGDKIFLQCPLTEIPSGCQVYGATTANNVNILSNGFPTRQNGYKMNLGKLVPHITFTESFSAVIGWTNNISPVADVRLQLIMYGLLYNSL